MTGGDPRYERRSGRAQAAGERSPQRRDRDRILYSPTFRRLSGITQIVSPFGYHPTHNRLTHTLEVAQIARSIAERLLAGSPDPDLIAACGGLDPDIVEAAALAHDLGHPPFGHVAERELDIQVSRERPDGFEGNAQTFRILARLDVRYEDTTGLDLTRATLSAVGKYPWMRAADGPRHLKWGAYDAERETFAWSRDHLPTAMRDRPTLEAAIMDWADDIAYAVHDLEDFYRMGLVPLDRLAADPDERARFLAARTPDPAAADPVLRGLLGIVPLDGPFDGSHLNQARLRQFSSLLVDQYVTGTGVEDPSRVPSGLAVSPDLLHEVALLKAVTRHYVIESDAVMAQRQGQAAAIGLLFATVLDDVGLHDARGAVAGLLPMFHREMIDRDPTSSVRVVADFIAGLTEPQVIALHQRVTGRPAGPDLQPVVF